MQEKTISMQELKNVLGVLKEYVDNKCNMAEAELITEDELNELMNSIFEG